jgi:hypothetical protein
MKTKAGTELPILKLRGKEYLEVKYRVLWFREEHQTWSIETEYVAIYDKAALAKATIKDDAGRIISTSHKYEDSTGFADYLEKSETSAIGRALALVGYGTQFCSDELDEGAHIVDSPREPKKIQPEPIKQQSSHIGGMPYPSHSEPVVEFDPGEYIVTIGKKYAGKKLKDIELNDIKSFVSWLEDQNSKENKPMSSKTKEFIANAEAYIAGIEGEPMGELKF